MSNNMSILDIRKSQFIEYPNYNNYQKLLEKIDRHKEIFDNKFFAEVTKKAFSKKDIHGLFYISQLYISLNRNIEAELILSKSYEIDKTNYETLYCYFDILCRRKQLGLLVSLRNKLDKTKNELMYVKCLIKYYLLTMKPDKLDDTIMFYYEKCITDYEFVHLIFIAALQNNNYYYTYMVSKTKFQYEIFNNLTEQGKRQINKHFYIIITDLLRNKISDN
jgi:hypothetical protein